MQGAAHWGTKYGEKNADKKKGCGKVPGRYRNSQASGRKISVRIQEKAKQKTTTKNAPIRGTTKTKTQRKEMGEIDKSTEEEKKDTRAVQKKGGVSPVETFGLT